MLNRRAFSVFKIILLSLVSLLCKFIVSNIAVFSILNWTASVLFCIPLILFLRNCAMKQTVVCYLDLKNSWHLKLVASQSLYNSTRCVCMCADCRASERKISKDSYKQKWPKRVDAYCFLWQRFWPIWKGICVLTLDLFSVSLPCHLSCDNDVYIDICWNLSAMLVLGDLVD